MQLPSDDDEAGRFLDGVDGPRGVLREIAEDDFYVDKGARYLPGQVWIEISGVAYDVSSFAERHPGGADVILKFTGKDASAAFHRVSHSTRARIMMQRFTIGSIYKRHPKYRLFEEQAMAAVIRLGAEFFAAVALVVYFAPAAAYADVDGILRLPPLIINGLFNCFWVSSAGLLAQLSLGQFSFDFSHLKLPETWIISVSILLFCCGWSLMLFGTSQISKAGLELSVLFLLCADEVITAIGGHNTRIKWSWHAVPGGVAAVTGVYVRHSRSSFCLRQVVGAIIIALVFTATAHALRCASGVRTVGVGRGLAAGNAVSAIASSVIIPCLLFVEQGDLGHLLNCLRSTNAASATSCAIAAFAGAHFLKRFFEHATELSALFAMRATANVFGLCSAIFVNLLSDMCWLSWVALIASNAAAASRHRRYHDEATRQGLLRRHVPGYMLGTRCLWDTTRTFLLSSIWASIHSWFRRLVNFILPAELQVHSLTVPIFDLGRSVSYGVAAYTAPESSQAAPQHFVFSASRCGPETSHFEKAQLNNCLVENWKTAQRTRINGLVGRVICFFPEKGISRSTLNVHLSCWQSSGAAETHDQAGICPSMGSKLVWQACGRAAGECAVSMRSKGALRHQDRCKMCFRLVESGLVGDRAPLRCQACGKDTFGYCFF